MSENGGPDTATSQFTAKGPRVDSAVPIYKLFTAEGDARRWDEMPKPPAPGVAKEDLNLLLTLYTANPWVFAAINRTAQAIAAVRRIYFRVDGMGKKTRANDTSLEMLLEHPNPFQTFEDLIELTVVDLRAVGWSWWEKVIDSTTKQTVGLWRLRPDKVTIRPDEERYWKGIEFERKPGDKVSLSPEEVVQFRNWSPVSDFFGVSGLFASQGSIVWDLFARAWNTSFFRNGAASFPEGVFESEQKVDEDTIKRIEERIKNKIGHPDVWRSPLVLDQGLQYKKTGATQHEMQFDALMAKARDEVLATLGVPPAMVGVPIAGGLGGFREQRHQFYQITVLPLLKKLQATVNRFLAPSGERFEFDLADILSLIEDVEAMTRNAESEVTRGIRTINEIRDERGQPKVVWGDTWWAPLGLAPVEVTGRPDRPPGLQPTQAAATSEEFTPRKMRMEFWKAAEDPVRRGMAAAFAGAYRRVFDELKRTIERKLEQQARPVEKAEEDESVAVVKATPQFEFTGAFDPFTEDDYRSLVRSTVGSEALKQTTAAGRAAARALGVDFTEIVESNPTFRKIVDSWLTARAGSTARTINAAVQRAADQARTDGLPKRRAIRRILAEFDRTVDQRIADLSASDATTFSSSALKIQGEQKFTHKRWIHAGDARDPVRGGKGESHISENFPSGPIVGINERFDVPGRNGINRMEFPGDPAGDADVTSHCRCSIELLTTEEAQAEGAA